MSLFSALRHLFRSRSAPPLPAGFVRYGLDRPDDAAELAPLAHPTKRWQPPGITRNDRIELIDEDVWGITFLIDYVDSRQHRTMRRISLRQLYRGIDSDALYIQAFCYERAAVRSFRFDHIRSLIEMDGTVRDPREFFEEELGVPVNNGVNLRAMAGIAAASPAKPKKAQSSGDKPGYAQRRVARDGARLLVWLCDKVDAARTEVVVDYIAERATLAGLDCATADREALRPYVRHQHPDVETIKECLGRLAAEPEGLRQLLSRYIRRLKGTPESGTDLVAELDVAINGRKG